MSILGRGDRKGKAPEVTHAWCVHQMVSTRWCRLSGWSGMKRKRGVGGGQGDAEPDHLGP